MKPTKDDIRRRLGLREVPKPPEDLARRIKAEIPASFRYREHVSAGTKADGPASASWGLSWQVAASFLALTVVGVGIYMVTFESQKKETAATAIAEADGRESLEFAPPTAPSSSAAARAQEAEAAPMAESEKRSNFADDFAPSQVPKLAAASPPPPPMPDADMSVAGGVEGGAEGGVTGGVVGGVIGSVSNEPADYRAEKPAEEQIAKSRDKGYAEEKESLAATAQAPAAIAEPGRRDAKDETSAAQASGSKPSSGLERASMLDDKAQPAPLRVGGDVKAPVVIKRVELVYPEKAKLREIQGIVIIEAIIDRDGNVKAAHVLKPLPMGLDEAAVAAVKQWKFKPATLHGKPVEVIFSLTVNAKLAR